ncbi:MAG TPA: YezD family protein [Verrucomicrobiae bacterium]|nr:YezD family protein [Verrucomicrobiae bacterium]
MTKSAKNEPQDQDSQSWLEVVRQQVASLRFGVVQIVVHDSRVVQIERTEKVRLDRKVTETT